MQQLVDELVSEYGPEDFGYLRSTWSSPLRADAIEQISESSPHPSTLRRLLDETGYAWKRARPTLHKPDPDKQEKLDAIHRACGACDRETATFFVDENCAIRGEYQRARMKIRPVTSDRNADANPKGIPDGPSHTSPALPSSAQTVCSAWS